jgi:hypothetical protein
MPAAAVPGGRLGLAALAVLLAQAPPARAAPPEELCRPAAMAAEIDAELPQGLLLAIARVESGRRDPATGAAIPWPWTINAEGVGRAFATLTEAVAAVQDLRARQVRLIDVGCMQVNLHYHPDAFASLEEAFDPVVNARYAARFLGRLRDATGDWDAAIGRYHSATTERADRYRARVLAAWPGAGRRVVVAVPDARRERLAAAWTGGPAADRAAPPVAMPGPPRTPRDAVEQAVVLWQRTRPGREAGRPAPEPAVLSRAPAPRGVRLGAR